MTSDFPTAPSAYGLNGPSATVTVEKSILASHTEILTAPDHLSCIAASLEELLAKRCAGQSTAIPPSIRWYLKDCFRETWRTAASAKQLTIATYS